MHIPEYRTLQMGKRRVLAIVHMYLDNNLDKVSRYERCTVLMHMLHIPEYRTLQMGKRRVLAMCICIWTKTLQPD